MIKINPKYIALIIAIILILFFAWFKSCNHSGTKPIQPPKTDTLRTKISHNKADLKVLTDSVPIYRDMAKKAIDRKNYYKQLYKSNYDSLYALSDSIGKIRLAITKEIKSKQDSAQQAENNANLLLIVNAYNQIGELKENEVFYEAKIKQDSLDAVKKDSIYKKQLTAEFKRGRKVGAKIGFIAGAVITEAANVAAKFKP